MPESKTLTGHTVAMVRLAEPEGGEAIVRRGEQLPANLAKGELERLERVGAFAEPPVANLAAQGARPAFAAVPDVRHVDPGPAPRGDLGALPLPPQVTLAANPEVPVSAKEQKARREAEARAAKEAADAEAAAVKAREEAEAAATAAAQGAGGSTPSGS